jgi:hypothetical protein
LEPTFCSQCGERRETGKAFCANCGRAFGAASGAALSGEATPALEASVLNRLRASDIAILGGATLLLVAPFFPFISATAAFVGSISRSGVEITSGEALVICAVGVIAGLVALRSIGSRKGAGLVLLGLVGLALTVYYYLKVDEVVGDVTSEAAFASIGAGMWMAFAGGILVTIGALSSMRLKATH